MPSSRRRVFLASYPRSGSTLLRTYFSLLQGRPQLSIHPGDVINESASPLTDAMAGVELVKSHQIPEGLEDLVYLVRDGRNATLSFLFMKFLLGNHTWERTEDVLDAIRYVDADEGAWSRHVRGAFTLDARRRVLVVKYEDLTQRPRWTLERILEFLSISVPPMTLDECVRLEKGLTTYARNPNNGFLFEPAPGSLYDVLKRHRQQDYWRVLFDSATRRYFHEQGGTEWLLRLGYETSIDWWRESA